MTHIFKLVPIMVLLFSLSECRTMNRIVNDDYDKIAFPDEDPFPSTWQEIPEVIDPSAMQADIKWDNFDRWGQYGPPLAPRFESRVYGEPLAPQTHPMVMNRIVNDYDDKIVFPNEDPFPSTWQEIPEVIDPSAMQQDIKWDNFDRWGQYGPPLAPRFESRAYGEPQTLRFQSRGYGVPLAPRTHPLNTLESQGFPQGTVIRGGVVTLPEY